MMYAMSKEAMRTKEVEVIQFTVYGEPQGKGRPRFVARYNPATQKSFGQAHTPEKRLFMKILFGRSILCRQRISAIPMMQCWI